MGYLPCTQPDQSFTGKLSHRTTMNCGLYGVPICPGAILIADSPAVAVDVHRARRPVCFMMRAGVAHAAVAVCAVGYTDSSVSACKWSQKLSRRRSCYNAVYNSRRSGRLSAKVRYHGADGKIRTEKIGACFESIFLPETLSETTPCATGQGMTDL